MALALRIRSLNHSSCRSATMVHEPARSLRGMDYTERLHTAMRLAGMDPAAPGSITALSKELGVSYQDSQGPPAQVVCLRGTWGLF